MANMRKENIASGKQAIAGNPQIQALIDQYVQSRKQGGHPVSKQAQEGHGIHAQLIKALQEMGIDTHDLRFDSKTGELEEKGWLDRNGGLAAALALAPVGGAFALPALMGGGAAAGTVPAASSFSATPLAAGGTAAGTTAAGAGGAGKGIMDFLKSDTGGGLLQSGLAMGAGAMTPDPVQPFEFSGLEGETGRLLTPENSHYNAMRATLGAALGIGRQSAGGVNMKSSMPGKLPTINIPGLGFDLGGVGQDAGSFANSYPGLDFSVPGNPNGDIISMLEGLLKPQVPKSLVPSPSKPAVPAGIPQDPMKPAVQPKARMRGPR